MGNNVKTYIGCKMIKARKALKVNGRVRFPGTTVSADDTVESGYIVEYPDGYKSWSPKDVFEKAYFEIDESGSITDKDADRFIKQMEGHADCEGNIMVSARTLNDFDIMKFGKAPILIKDNENDEKCIEEASRLVDEMRNSVENYLNFVYCWANLGVKNEGKKKNDVL